MPFQHPFGAAADRHLHQMAQPIAERTHCTWRVQCQAQRLLGIEGSSTKRACLLMSTRHNTPGVDQGSMHGQWLVATRRVAVASTASWTPPRCGFGSLLQTRRLASVGHRAPLRFSHHACRIQQTLCKLARKRWWIQTRGIYAAVMNAAPGGTAMH
jgi:hypothetical protein